MNQCPLPNNGTTAPQWNQKTVTNYEAPDIKISWKVLPSTLRVAKLLDMSKEEALNRHYLHYNFTNYQSQRSGMSEIE